MFLFESVLPMGAAAAALMAAWLVESKQNVIENIAPVLARVFSPLTILLLGSLLVAFAINPDVIDVERELLILMSGILVLVLALGLYALSARDLWTEPFGRPRRRTSMWSLVATTVASGLLVLAGCSSDDAGGQATSGVIGHVTLGPTCPVESAGTPCEDQQPANVVVTVSEALPGEAYGAGPTVARGTTDSEGSFRIAVSPGDYIVTASAGMSCELMDARVLDDTFVTVAVTCDTGIR